MCAHPSQRFFDDQRRGLAHHDFDRFQAEHHVNTATGQVDMGRWVIFLTQLYAVFIANRYLVDMNHKLSPNRRYRNTGHPPRLSQHVTLHSETE